jgi:hypothetical protein
VTTAHTKREKQSVEIGGMPTALARATILAAEAHDA